VPSYQELFETPRRQVVEVYETGKGFGDIFKMYYFNAHKTISIVFKSVH